jgi:hypothetical protein
MNGRLAESEEEDPAFEDTGEAGGRLAVGVLICSVRDTWGRFEVFIV